MTKQGSVILLTLSFPLLYLNHFTAITTLAQSPVQSPAESPAQSAVHPRPGRAHAGPTDVTKILEKAGGFSVFLSLLKSTSVSAQIENRLNVSNSLTIFAPTNVAFSGLRPGTLNALSGEQKAQLVNCHVAPSLVSLQNFQTLSKPYPLNVTVEGSLVNVSTGMVNATISATIYEDSQLAIYKVDKVLLPPGIFGPNNTAAPAPTVAVHPDDFPASFLLAPAIAALLNDASRAVRAAAENGVVLSVGFAAFCLVGF